MLQRNWANSSFDLGSSDHLSLHHKEGKLREQPAPGAALQALNNGGSVRDSRLGLTGENRSWKEIERQKVPYVGHSVFWTTFFW